MDNILSHRDLCKIIAARVNKKEGDVGLFLDALVQTFTEGIIRDKSLRIKGLGSFKLITVAPRESISIVTGEKILIDSFNKIHYVADKDAKNLAISEEDVSEEKGDEMPEVVNEDMEDMSMEKFDDQAREILEILGEMGESIPTFSEEDNSNEEEAQNDIIPIQEKKEEASEKFSEEDNSNEEEAQNDITPVQDEKEEEADSDTSSTANDAYGDDKSWIASSQEEDKKEVANRGVLSDSLEGTNGDKESDKTSENETSEGNNKNQIIMDYRDRLDANQSIPEVNIPEEEMEEEEEEGKKSHLVRDILITLGVSIIVVVLCLLFLRKKIVGFIDGMGTSKVETVVQAEMPVTEPVVMPEPVEDKSVDELSSLQYTKFITSVRVPSGNWLAKLSRKYYGETDLWVFIYDANKDHISNPHNLSVGTVVRIPELSNELKNLSNPRTKRLVEALMKKYK